MKKAKIIEFLKNNPDFLINNYEILPSYKNKDNSNITISLAEYKSEKIHTQNILLRNKNTKLQSKIKFLHENSIQNEKIFEGMHKIILDLCKNLELSDQLDMLKKNLKKIFKLDAFVKFSSYKKTTANRLYFCKKNLSPCFTSSPIEDFKEEFKISNRNRSFAYINIRSKKIIGILCLASKDPKHFNEDKDIFFLKKLSEVIAVSLERNFKND